MRLFRAVAERLRRPAHAPANPVVVDCAAWRQGDVFSVDGVWTTGVDGQPLWMRTPLGVAVISQSCDAAQRIRDRVHVAPVVELKGIAAVEAASGKRISFAALHELGDEYFADLETVVTLPKATLAGASRTPGVVNDAQVRRFGGSVARKYGRFAFPDDVVRALDPLRDVLRSKARKEQTPLGRVLADVYAIRVEAANPGWLTPPFDLHLIVVFEPGVVPTFDDGDLPDEPAGLRDRVLGAADIAARSSQIAEAFHDATTPEDRYWLITMLAESWAAKCETEADRKGVRATVRSVLAEVTSADEFPMSRVNNSEDLDLDYLSEPLPRSPRNSPR